MANIVRTSKLLLMLTLLVTLLTSADVLVAFCVAEVAATAIVAGA